MGGHQKCLENREKSGNFEIENEWQPCYLFHGKKFGLLNTAGVKSSMSQATRKLKFEVDVAVIYVCKAFWQEINTPAHLRHCQDSSEFKSWHLSSAISLLFPGSHHSACVLVGQCGGGGEQALGSRCSYENREH